MKFRFLVPLLAVIVLLAACTSAATAQPQQADTLVIYSGRSEDLVGPLIAMFEEQSGIQAEVRYGETAGMAATIIEEGTGSPADVFFGQDAGALGALAQEGVLAPLPQDLLDQVEPRFRSSEGFWVGTSGRARVVAYNPAQVRPDDLPESILGFTDPVWKGRIGWAPTNGSFQAFVTALRVVEGEDMARRWLQGILANDPVVYPSNHVALLGVASGEVDVAFINHYYLYQELVNDPELNAALYFPPNGDIGALVNVAGAAILKSAPHAQGAEAFVRFLLSEQAQRYFSEETFEYPLVAGIPADPRLPRLQSLATPDIDLSDLSSLAQTLALLEEVGALE